MTARSILKALRQRAKDVDKRLTGLWPKLDNACLVAVGGYGRGSLFPYSDIDLLIINQDPDNEPALIQFLQAAWDQKLKVSHSSRTATQCIADAKHDLAFYTSLLEMRLLAGDAIVFEHLQSKVLGESIWNKSDFFHAKLAEQKARQEHYAQNIEPNVKNCPGGLRDAHLIYWLAIKFFAKNELRRLLTSHLLTRQEYRDLWQATQHLATLRYQLHTTCHKAEDRLLFDHQKQLAESQHTTPCTKTEIERFMQTFYRTTQTILNLSDLVSNQFEELLIQPEPSPHAKPDLPPGFTLKNHKLEVVSNKVFFDEPANVIESFIILCQHPDIHNFTSHTIRSIQFTCQQLPQHAWGSPACRQAFLSLFQQPHGLSRQLEKMNRYGVLSAYFPFYRTLMGQMQFDLFHVHTVDIHTIQVIKQLRKIGFNELAQDLPLATRLMHTLQPRRPLYLAAFFHDLGKGRGVDHAQWGAGAAKQFCIEHDIPKGEAHLIAWLVEHHLLLSQTAQKADLTDMAVIQQFAEHVNSPRRLDYLYLLTVADIRGTNPSLWTSWRASLLEQLYHSAHAAMTQQPQLWVNKKKQALLQNLTHTEKHTADHYWPYFSNGYFQHFSPKKLTRHLHQFAALSPSQPPWVEVETNSLHLQCEATIIGPRKPYMFATVTAIIHQLNLSIAEARIVTFENKQFVLAYFVLLTQDNKVIRDAALMRDTQRHLESALQSNSPPSIASKRQPTDLALFDSGTAIKVTPSTGQTLNIEINTLDRPGLLAHVAHVLHQHHYQVLFAKVMTTGEQVSDILKVEPTPLEGPIDREQLAVDLKHAIEDLS